MTKMSNEELVEQWAATIPGEDSLNKALRRTSLMLLEDHLPEADEYQAEKLVRNFTEHIAQLHELLLWKRGVAPQQIEKGDLEKEEVEARRLEIRRQMMDQMQIVRERYEAILSAMPGMSRN